ncbi:TetR/AcrR family transcriptional regulator [Rhodococcus qingshengii]|uniref:TetR/AcrR family transcriptional regulator n=1 Tax=Rhodococcus qingshengii TaxID=334542 RepID=UPI0037C5E333
MGRPRRLDIDTLLATALHLGLETFTMSQVSDHLQVSEGTIYNYVRSREELRGRAAAQAMESIDTAQTALDDWVDYLIAVNGQLREIAQAHPGVSVYYLHGPYRPQTLVYFNQVISGLVSRMPGADADLGFVLASHASNTTLSFLSLADEHVFRRVLTATLPALHHALHGSAPTGVSWDSVVESVSLSMETEDCRE